VTLLVTVKYNNKSSKSLKGLKVKYGAWIQ